MQVNAATAAQLHLHDKVMLDNDPGMTGIIIGVDPIREQVKIIWSPEVGLYCFWHAYDDLADVETYQPAQAG
jgi:uncharacterized protein YigE (DUF2233 family)